MMTRTQAPRSNSIATSTERLDRREVRRAQDPAPATPVDHFDRRSTTMMTPFIAPTTDASRVHLLGMQQRPGSAVKRGLAGMEDEDTYEATGARALQEATTPQPEQIVDDAYQRLLLRAPDAEGLKTHADLVNDVLAGGGTPEQAREAVDASIKSSDEHAVIERVNQSFERVLGRTPAEKGYWHDEGLKMRAQGASLDEISGRLEDAHRQSDEYLLQHPEAIVTGLYQDLLGRAPDAEGLSTWSEKASALMAEGKAPSEARDIIADDIRASAEYQARHAPPDDVDAAGDISSPDTPAWQNVNRWDAQVLEAVAQVERETGVRVPPNLVKAMMRLESGGDASALTPTGNPDGPYAIGLMQVVPGLSYGTYDAARLRDDPTYQIYAGARDLAYRYQEPRNSYGWDGALRAYFSGNPAPNHAQDVLGTSTNQYHDVITGYWDELGR